MSGALAQPGSAAAQKSIIEIYTDWANHYLDKLKGRRPKIKDLQSELADGLVLADVIEAVMSQKVPDVLRKPKGPTQMVHNLQASLNFLKSKGVAGVEDISASDLRDGNLKSILGLFFQLSRFKQQQKLQQQNVTPRGGLSDPRASTPRIPSLPSSPAKHTGIPGPGSAIPQPQTGRKSNGEKRSMLSKLGSRQNSASNLKPPGVPSSAANAKSAIPNPKGSSMLDRLKLGGGSKATSQQNTLLPKPSNGCPGPPPQPPIRYQYSPRETGLGKRTSSSSGFSSARSVGSESSVSLSSDTNFPSPSALRRINENSTFSTPTPTSPKAGRQRKLSSPTSMRNAHQRASSSPKRSPKFQRANTEIKDYGPIDHYPPHKGGSRIPGSAKVTVSRANSTGIPQGHRGISAGGSSFSRIPHQNGQSSMTSDCQTSGQPQSLPNGCTVKPLQAEKRDPQKANPTSAEPDESMTASFHSKTCSLPRQTRPLEGGNVSNAQQIVAVVSPMPSTKKGMALDSASVQAAMEAAGCKSTKPRDKEDEAGDEDASLKNIVPMAPIFGAQGDKASPGHPSFHLSGKSESPYGFLAHGATRGMGNNHVTVNTTSIHQTGPSSKDLRRSSGGGGGSIDVGYLSDGDTAFFSHNKPSHQAHLDDGYLSEGGASFYARKIQNRIALEKQRTAEEQRQKFGRPLPGLPEVLGNHHPSLVPSHLVTAANGSMKPPLSSHHGAGGQEQESSSIYRVVGNRNKPRSETGIQTDTASAVQHPPQHVDWKQAMAHNARVLSSQEKAMDEYLRRQRAMAEQHIQQANSHRHRPLVGTREDGRGASNYAPPFSSPGFQSVPGTPLEARKARPPHQPTTTSPSSNGVSSAPHYYQQQAQQQQQQEQQVRAHSNLTEGVGHYFMASNARGNGPPGPQRQSLQQGGRNGGSLERKLKRQDHQGFYGCASDSEYGRLLSTPMANRKSQAATPSNGTNTSPSGSLRRDPAFGSKSLPKGTSASLNYGLMLERIQQKRQQRGQGVGALANSGANGRTNDGSLSDSNYATYTDVQSMRSGSQSPFSWLQPASTYASLQDPYPPWNGLSEPSEMSSFSGMASDVMGSNESLNSVSSSIQQARANSLTKARLQMHQRSISPRNSLQRNQAQQHSGPNRGDSESSYPRSNSAVSSGRPGTESDYYGVPFRMSNEGRYKSQPTSPAKPKSQALSLAPAHPSYVNFNSPPTSTPEHVVSMTLDQRTDYEIQKLRRELVDENDKVKNLTSQLVTNAHVVSAFEQSLSNMTSRLHQLTTTSEKKDSELNELRRTIDRLRQSGADVGLIAQPHDLMRQKSTDSVTSVCSTVSQSNGLEEKKGSSHNSKSGVPKRSGWLRHSFSKAFSKGSTVPPAPKPGKTSKGGSMSDVEDGNISKLYYEERLGAHPPTFPRASSAASGTMVLDGEGSDQPVEPEVVEELKKQLLVKDSLLTETRLEALSSAHQLESLRETVTKMRSELINLKSDNERLQSSLSHQPASGVKSLSSSQSSLNGSCSMTGISNQSPVELKERPHSVTMSEVDSVLSGPSSLDLSGSTDPTNKDGGKLVPVSVNAQSHGLVRLGVISVSGKSNWDLLDSLVHRLFKEYVMRVDPVSNLGLNAESIDSYEVGEIKRSSNSTSKPEYLPYGYLVGHSNDVRINLRQAAIGGQVDMVAFETLTPKSIVQRYISLLVEHKRIILSGPAGTGKSFMAKILADFLVHRRRATPGNTPNEELTTTVDPIMTFQVDMNNRNELKRLLSRMCEHAGQPNGRSVLPKVLILDDLHHAGKLDELFGDALMAHHEFCPYIIGTMTHSTTASTTNLQLKHNFRLILFAYHIEPVRGFLGRFLRKRLLDVETATRVHDSDMVSILEWIPRVYIQVNKFLESHSSPEVTLGPSLFLSCPIDIKSSRTWFIDLWNNSLVPHLLDSVREGIQMYGRRAPWEDPLQFVVDTWPWAEPPGDELGNEALVPIRPQDVGYDPNEPLAPVTNNTRPLSNSDSMGSGGDNGPSDPLFNMLMHLQEAASQHPLPEDD